MSKTSAFPKSDNSKAVTKTLHKNYCKQSIAQYISTNHTESTIQSLCITN